MTETIALIPCCGPKLDTAAAARDLYTSSTFRTQLDAALASGCDRVMIVSAKHGLLDLDEQCAPYDVRIEQTTLTPESLAAQALSVLGDDIGGVWAFLPSKYLALVDAAFRLLDVYVQDVYEDCAWMGRAGGIGEHRHICKIVKQSATSEGN